MNSNPIHHPSLANKMKCSFLGYVQLLMISQAVLWTQTPSSTSLQPIKWNAHFWIMFNFWWSARLVDGLEPHPPAVPSKKWNAHILIMFNFWWLARLVNGLKPHPPLLSSQKKWNAHFWITFTSDDWPGWLMNLNLICHPSPPIKMKCSIFDYVQLLMISQADQLT